jgi:hypothetical protein
MPQPLCAFSECIETGCFGFREPGIENLQHRNPKAQEIFTCHMHREHEPQLLQVKIDSADLARANALAGEARLREGKLL